MTKLAILLAIPILLMSCASQADQKCNAANGVIYDSDSDRRSEVFNMNTLLFSVQSQKEANLTDTSSEFAGPIDLCSSATYWCISSPISLVIPKLESEFQLGRWRREGLSCEVRSRVGSTAIITCRSAADSATTAKLAKGRGVVSYSREGVGDDAMFGVRGECGLFPEVPFAHK